MYELFPLRRIRAAHPVQSYAEATSRLQALLTTEEAEGNQLDARCHTFLLTHNMPSDHGFVLIHGFTNCPYQFQKLAPLLHAQGHNVLAIRLPRHGVADRMTTALASLQISETLDAVTEAVDIAQGLAKHVTVLGFSMGGILAAWLAQQRADLYQVILISPAIGIQAIPAPRRRLAAHLLGLLPNFYQWWNPALKEQKVAPLHAYPRFASKSLAVLLRLGLIVRDGAERAAPATKKITYIGNPSDPVIDHEVVEVLLTQWQQQGAAVTRHAFPAAWSLLHDFVDPLQPEQQVDRVYPLLLQWIEQSLASTVEQ